MLFPHFPRMRTTPLNVRRAPPHSAGFFQCLLEKMLCGGSLLSVSLVNLRTI